MSSLRAYKPVLCLLALAAWAWCGWLQSGLNRDRDTLGLTRVEPLENAPPVLAFTTVALGGFRGLIANLLWVRIGMMQESGRYFEMVQLADWITKLQPHFTTVWIYQGWNMVYNVSTKFQEPRDRWQWVQRGVELLRDQGLVYNPHDALIHRELAWFFQHKIGYYLDDAHLYYKGEWAKQMTQIFGTALPNYPELLNPPDEAARTRVKLLREKYKLDPARMQEVDRRYGPLDWRLPDAHAIYWAQLGLDRAKDRANEFQLRMVIYQSMQMSMHRGRLVTYPERATFEFGPNLAIIGKANEAYERMMAAMPDKAERISVGHGNFLKDAVYFLYVYNRQAEAAKWFKFLKEKYPEIVAPGQSLDEFAVSRIGDQLKGASINKVNAIIEGMLSTAYYQLALGETDHAAGLNTLAEKVWTQHMTRFADQQQRMALDPMSVFRARVLERVLAPESSLHPQLKAQLRTALSLPPTTNAPAAKPPGGK